MNPLTKQDCQNAYNLIWMVYDNYDKLLAKTTETLEIWGVEFWFREVFEIYQYIYNLFCL